MYNNSRSAQQVDVQRSLSNGHSLNMSVRWRRKDTELVGTGLNTSIYKDTGLSWAEQVCGEPPPLTEGMVEWSSHACWGWGTGSASRRMTMVLA